MRWCGICVGLSCCLLLIVVVLSGCAVILPIDDSEVQISSGELLDPLRNARTFRVLLVGDTGGVPIMETTWAQRDVSTSMEQLAAANDVQMVLNMGDNIYFTGPEDENDKRFKTRFEDVYSASSLNVPWLTIAGNHDHFGNVTAEIEYTKKSDKWYFPSLYYKKTAEWNNSHVDFVMIDTIELCGNTRDIQNAGFFEMFFAASHDPDKPVNATAAELQWSWIEQQLKSSTAEYLVVSGHYPMHSISSHGPTKCLQDRLDPLLKKYNVSAYFSGHDHSLQHFVFPGNDEHEVHYLVSGAASRADASEKHKELYTEKNFMYPQKKFFPWKPFSQLGLREGGFIYAEFGHENAQLKFYNKDGQLVYDKVVIPTRELPKGNEKLDVKDEMSVNML